MDLTPFTTTELTARHDGWNPEGKLRLLDRLAACGNVRTACARVGLAREAAYRLRRRDALFARGWDAALMLARPRGAEVLADKATEGIEEEVWYRGEMVGTRRRFDARLLLAHIARLDRMAEELPKETTEDAARFDELLARIGGVQAPQHLEVEDHPLPLDRDTAILMAEEIARDDARACEEAGARWDAWFTGACEAVDGLLSGTAQEPEAETSFGDANDAGAAGDTGTETLRPSTVSTCQLHPSARRPGAGVSPPLRHAELVSASIVPSRPVGPGGEMDPETSSR